MIDKIKPELELLVKAFSVSEKVDISIISEKLLVKIGDSFLFTSKKILEKEKRLFIRECKRALYLALNKYTGKALPWGSLTGIRPSKMARELENPKASLVKKYFVSKNKARLIATVIKNQEGIFAPQTKEIAIYIHIPFCPRKCKYCSFASSTSLEKIGDYIKTLIKEIKAAGNIIAKNRLKIHSIYIGGGTPSILPDKEFEKLLLEISLAFLQEESTLAKTTEFTVEAGLPSTITEVKCVLMQKYGVTRVCVNPQSLNDKALSAIGRGATNDEFFNAFKLAKKLDFLINCDLIAGLNGDDEKGFLHSLKGVIRLEPDNITIHALSKKRGSELFDYPKKNSPQENGFTKSTNDSLNEKCQDAAYSLDGAIKLLQKNSYKPYYLYRQKYQRGNLENIGFSKNGRLCKNNIAVMEECVSVLGFGAGAISKRIYFSQNRIERLAAAKDIDLYIKRIDEFIALKNDFFVDHNN